MIRSFTLRLLLLAVLLFHCDAVSVAQQPPQSLDTSRSISTPSTSPNEKSNTTKQAKLEAGLAKMLSGATLEGSFTKTSAGNDPSQLAREKYTLGEVKKLKGNLWLIPARIEYGEKDATIPITLPIEWAGDTPVVVVDNLPLPGFGAVSARVMFFADHYAGFWQHGESGGHLFGTIRREGVQIENSDSPK